MCDTVPPLQTKSDYEGGGSSSAPLSERYVIGEEIGRGGMGIVYRAVHRHLNMPMAVKVLRKDIDRDRFLREAQLLAKIKSPFVVGVHDYEFQADGSPMLVMELLDGEGLEATIARGKLLPEAQVVTWMRQAATALAAAAELGIVHRDVKPSNIRINSQGQARLMDFGLARADSVSLAMTSSNQYLGTPYYMSPEQAEDPRSVDARADMYSYGATFYHALTGRPPFEGATHFAVLFKHKTEPLTAVQSLNPAVSKVVAEVIERCLAKSPASRFSSFEEIIRCLSPAEESLRPWRTGDENAVSPHFEQFKARRESYLRREMSNGPEDVYTFKNGCLKIELGDIARQQVDVIVSADNSHLTMDFGCSQAIGRAAGEEIYRLVQQFVPVLPGRVIVTPGGRLQCRFIFHAVTNGFVKQSIRATRDIIAELISAIFYHADTLSVQSLALPLLGAGGARLAQEEALEAMFLTLARHLDRGVTSVQEVRLVLYRDTLVALHNVLQPEPPKPREPERE